MGAQSRSRHLDGVELHADSGMHLLTFVVVGILLAGRISATEQAAAGDVMQPGPATVRAHEDVDATRQRMNQRHVAHLLVTTPNGNLIGVVEAADS